MGQPNRLEQVEFRGGIPIDGTSKRSGNLPPPDPNRRRILRFHVPSLLDSYCYSNGFKFMDLFVVNDPYIKMVQMQPRSIILVVDSEKQEKEVKRGIQALEVERWKQLFVVEMEM